MRNYVAISYSYMFSLNDSYFQNLLFAKLWFRMMTKRELISGEKLENSIRFQSIFLPDSSIRIFKRQKDSIIVTGL